MTGVQVGVTPTTAGSRSGQAPSETSSAKGTRTTPTNATSKHLDTAVTMQMSTLNVPVSKYQVCVHSMCDPGNPFLIYILSQDSLKSASRV